MTQEQLVQQLIPTHQPLISRGLRLVHVHYELDVLDLKDRRQCLKARLYNNIEYLHLERVGELREQGLPLPELIMLDFRLNCKYWDVIREGTRMRHVK